MIILVLNNKIKNIKKGLAYHFVKKILPLSPKAGETEGLTGVAFQQEKCKPNFDCAQIL